MPIGYAVASLLGNGASHAEAKLLVLRLRPEEEVYRQDLSVRGETRLLGCPLRMKWVSCLSIPHLLHGERGSGWMGASRDPGLHSLVPENDGCRAFVRRTVLALDAPAFPALGESLEDEVVRDRVLLSY